MCMYHMHMPVTVTQPLKPRLPHSSLNRNNKAGTYYAEHRRASHCQGGRDRTQQAAGRGASRQMGKKQAAASQLVPHSWHCHLKMSGGTAATVGS